jgi:hypothetical protein
MEGNACCPLVPAAAARRGLGVDSVRELSARPAIRAASWLIVHPSDAQEAVALLGELIARQPKTMSVGSGDGIPLSDQDYDWDRIVLEPGPQAALRADFETFWKRRDWFARNRLPYRRGYLLHGPPGNGKTTVVRTMVSHPRVSAFGIDLGSRDVSNRPVTKLFEQAALNAPSVIVFEDLDRSPFAADYEDGGVDLPHLLNCLDGLQSKEGVLVVATGFLDDSTLDCLALMSDGLSFAQVRESYILAGQSAFVRNDEVTTSDLQEAIGQVRSQFTKNIGRPQAPDVGFSHA